MHWCKIFDVSRIDKVIYNSKLRTVKEIMDANTVRSVFGKPFTKKGALPPKCKDNSGKDVTLRFIPKKDGELEKLKIEPEFLKNLAEKCDNVGYYFHMELVEGNLILQIVEALSPGKFVLDQRFPLSMCSWNNIILCNLNMIDF